MKKIDCNCMIGHWPYRKLREIGINAIKTKHNETGITCGLVSNINSIFYNDYMEGEAELAGELAKTDYKHVMSLNPMLPCFDEDIETALEKYNIVAVRIYPGYHQYELCNNPNVDKLCRVLKEKKLPLFISVRLEDERLNYLAKPLTPEEFGLFEFLKKEPPCKTLLLTIKKNELLTNIEVIKQSGVWYDMSGLKDNPFCIESLCDRMGGDKLVYGSQYPLFSLRSTLYLVERDGLPTELVEKIMWKNSAILLKGTGNNDY